MRDSLGWSKWNEMMILLKFISHNKQQKPKKNQKKMK